MNSNVEKLYTKIVHVDEIYNLVQMIFVQNHNRAQIIDITLRYKIQILDLNIMLIIWAWRWFKIKNIWTTNL
jgi:hypothetical protein